MSKHLVIFDIDGTIIDSVKTDDDCFMETFRNLYGIDLTGTDWNDFQHVTDSGLTREIFIQNFDRLPEVEEIEKIKTHFYGLLAQAENQYREIKGALAFIDQLAQHGQFQVAFATGGWRETAILKMNSIEFAIENHVFKSSNDHYSRAEITKLAIEESLSRANSSLFSAVTYVGDGLWDLHTSNGLGIDFIGVDAHGKGKLGKAGAEKIVRNFQDRRIGEWLSL